jgi:site-specific DNA-methyltransferase (adenine-specific)
MFYGDCLEVMARLPDKSVDCFICDLPYGCLTGGGITKVETAKQYGRKGTEGISGCAWDIPLNLDAFWTQVKRLRKDDHSPCLMFCTTKFGYDLIKSNEKEFRYDLVWDKKRGVSFLTVNKMPMRSHEMIYVFSKSGAFYNRVDISGNYASCRRGEGKAPSNVYGVVPFHCKDTPMDKRCAVSVIQTQTKAIKGNHPTEKPEALYRFLIERYCPADGTMLDPTAGSFNSVFTALAMGRDGVGIEKDKAFFLKAKARAMAYSAGGL